jgi:hypothetical protein
MKDDAEKNVRTIRLPGFSTALPPNRAEDVDLNASDRRDVSHNYRGRSNLREYFMGNFGRAF